MRNHGAWNDWLLRLFPGIENVLKRAVCDVPQVYPHARGRRSVQQGLLPTGWRFSHRPGRLLTIRPRSLGGSSAGGRQALWGIGASAEPRPVTGHHGPAKLVVLAVAMAIARGTTTSAGFIRCQLLERLR